MKKGILIVVYTDDCIFVGPTKKAIRREIELLKKEEFDLDEEEDIAGFLGVEISTASDGTKTLTQKGLTERVLKLMGLEDVSGKSTPAEYGTIGSDKDGEPLDTEWNYSSALDMMMYLATNARPDIAFSVNQCARFSNRPTEKHGRAMKRITAYLKQTKNKRTIISPTADLTLDLWVDADFADLWNMEDVKDPICVRSRTGYVITLGGVPVIWKCKLQTEIALSTTESEYIAACMGTRELLPMRRILDEICETMGIVRPMSMTMSTVWEDNAAALTLMNPPLRKMTPRSKHMAVKYHWVRSKVGNRDKRGNITISAKKIETKDQRADIFNKGLRTADFERIRKFLIGW